MMDSLALPMLFGIFLLFVLGIWVFWLRNPKGRAIRIVDDDDATDR